VSVRAKRSGRRAELGNLERTRSAEESPAPHPPRIQDEVKQRRKNRL